MLAARARQHFAELLLKQGERSGANDLLNTALATFQELDLKQDLDAVQCLLAASV